MSLRHHIPSSIWNLLSSLLLSVIFLTFYCTWFCFLCLLVNIALVCQITVRVCFYQKNSFLKKLIDLDRLTCSFFSFVLFVCIVGRFSENHFVMFIIWFQHQINSALLNHHEFPVSMPFHIFYSLSKDWIVH